MGTAQIGTQAAQAHVVTVAHAQATCLHASYYREHVLSNNAARY